MPTVWKRKRRRRHNKSRPLRPEFVRLRHNREELLRRRKHYIHEYARILNKLKFRERVVRELLRRPGGVAVVDWHEHRQELEQIREKRQSQGGMLKGKETTIESELSITPNFFIKKWSDE